MGGGPSQFLYWARYATLSRFSRIRPNELLWALEATRGRDDRRSSRHREVGAGDWCAGQARDSRDGFVDLSEVFSGTTSSPGVD